jgi:drug/metabolite transporter (DMT)-like permease
LKETQQKPGTVPYTALIAGICSIGMSAIFIRLANAPGVVSSFYRFVIGAAVMAIPFYLKTQQRNERLPKKGVGLAVLGGFFFSLDMIFWSTGIVISGAIIPTLLVNTAPVWVGLGSWLVFKEKQSSKFWLGLVIAVSGASLVLGLDMSRSVNFGLGAWYGIFSAIFYGAYHLTSQRGREYLSTLSYFWISTTVSAIFLFLYALILKMPLAGFDPKTWILFLVMGILVQAFGWMFINYAHGHIPAAIVSPSLLAQPLMTAVVASFLLGEHLTRWHILGGILVICGVFLVHKSKHPI